MKEFWDGPERRRFGRYDVDLQASFQVLRPEDTFTPLALVGRVTELGDGGARATALNLDEDDYNELKDNPNARFIRIMCNLPGGRESIRLFGTVVYFAYDDSGPRAVTHLGVRFGDMPRADHTRLAEFLAELEAGAGTPE